ncbi:Mlo-related protein [Arabidopsis thaliana x Arabidopsis arenosa]|uniref:MLO-like protein n=1 Tax=Arabidopsis thaliana x Arabidopsis arenosa TaxID=1240361 RepID=A0A8T1XHY6_9BRAS|nr:Mlo-related protein [Arabidopsis thaliana x Arabidopsis arenosa]KAG7534118.1 Mlo-related protein [Arabidopsis thaliana x Arabidopsis arenosa]
MGEGEETGNEADSNERSLALSPTWSVAIVLTVFVVVSLIVERSIYRLSTWLRKTKRKPMFAALEKMKEELMLLGFISLLLTATSSTIANICVPSSFYNDRFVPCTRSEIQEELESGSTVKRNLLTKSLFFNIFRRRLDVIKRTTCSEGHEPFVSYEGLEQLHRFIFIMAVTHVTYSCLTMLLAIVKIHSWRIWEDVARLDRHDCLTAVAREKIFRRQTTFVQYHTSAPMAKNRILIWVTCFFRQFGRSVDRSDYLTLRKGFIVNHHLTLKYDFHSYMIRSMEEEFQRIVGVSGPLWGFVVAFMLFNIKGSNLYFWIAIIPVTLVLLVGAKLQHVIATLALENAGLTEYPSGVKLRPRDELFWFNKPELLLSLIHFILFQNSFELASFFWFWWQFGYSSCFLKNHYLVYFRLLLGFAGQFLCSYSTLPLYALVTQMGTNYKAALIPQRIRETIRGWGKATRRKRRHGLYGDDSTVRTETSTIASIEEYDHQVLDVTETSFEQQQKQQQQGTTELELQPIQPRSDCVPNESSSRVGTPLLRPWLSISSPTTTIELRSEPMEPLSRSSSLPSEKRV